MVISGIIRPPPEIRTVADKTAEFVAKNGRMFEQRILKSEKGKTPKFAFLQPTSPFHAYYEDRILFFQNGGKEEEEKKMRQLEGERKEKEAEKKEERRSEEEAVVVATRKQADKSQRTGVVEPVARALLQQRDKIRKQREEQTKQNEGKNSAEQTPIVTTPPPSLHFVNITAPPHLSPAQVETIKLVAQFTALDDSKGFLQNLTTREWDNPSMAFLQPRHPNFVYFSALVDCYKYLMSPHRARPPTTLPACLEQAAYRSEYERDMVERKQASGNDDAPDPIDWHDFVVVETIDFAIDENVDAPLPPERPSVATAGNDNMEESDEDEEQIRVVPNYTPKVVSTDGRVQDRTHVIDPITGKSIAVADMSEHMRIQLLDPKWAEEKRKFQEKQKESNLVDGVSIANNLSRVIGSDENDLDSDPKKRLREANKILQQQAEQARTQQQGPTLPPHPTDLMGPPPSKRPRTMDSPPPSMPPLPPGFPPPPPPGLPPAPFDPTAPPPPQATEESNPLLPASEFVATLASPKVQLEIRIPHDPAQMAYNFYGQMVSLAEVDIMSTIKQVKEKLRTHLNDIPANKLQLKHSAQGFLNNSQTLANYNLGPVATLEMVPKTRGGRKNA